MMLAFSSSLVSTSSSQADPKMREEGPKPPVGCCPTELEEPRLEGFFRASVLRRFVLTSMFVPPYLSFPLPPPGTVYVCVLIAFAGEQLSETAIDWSTLGVLAAA
jgi:hypothetical protein